MGTIPNHKTKVDPTYTEAIGLCDEIDNMITELPERAEEFGSSLTEKVASFRETIEKTKRASDKQITALENMRDGAEKWLR